MAKKFLRALLYARQSSGKEEESASVEAQLEACRHYAETHGIEVAEEFSDANTSGRLYPTGADHIASQDLALAKWLKGHSTEKSERPGLGKLLTTLGKVDVVIVYDLTRLYRSVRFSFLENYVNQRLAAANVQIISIKEGEVNFDSFASTLTNSIQQQVNDNQIQITCEKSRAAMEKIRDSGYYPTQPKMYGIRYIGGSERTVEVIPERAEVIRYVYDHILARKPYNQLLQSLNQNFSDRCDGKGFYDSSWRHIIENPFYCGYMYNSAGELIPAKQMEGKTIVTYEEWRLANDIVNAPAKNSKVGEKVRRQTVHPFSGKLYCGNCGARLTFMDDKGKIVYFCRDGVNARQDQACSGSRTVTTLNRESEEFTGLRDAVRPFLLLSLYKDVESKGMTGKMKAKLEQLDIEAKNLDVRLENLSELYVAGEISNFKAYEKAFTTAERKKVKVRNEILELEHKIASAKGAEERATKYLAMVDNLLYGNIEDGEYRNLLDQAVRRINCFHDHIDIDTVYGQVTLPRLIKGKFRNFPKFACQIEARNSSREIKNLNDCIINVTYIYGKTEIRKLVIDLSVMKIFTQGF